MNDKLGPQNITGGNNNNINIGVLFKVRNNKNVKEEKINEGFLNEYIKKRYYENGVNRSNTETILNSILENKNKIENRPSVQKNSKCITIYGNLYYYLNNNDNNCFISEYGN